MRSLSLVIITCISLQVASAAQADETATMVEQLARTRILSCLHPTVNTTSAVVELGARTSTSGDTSLQRVKVFYDGLIRKNALEMDVVLRASGTIRQFRVNVLSDTSPTVVNCALTKGWTDY